MIGMWTLISFFELLKRFKVCGVGVDWAGSRLVNLFYNAYDGQHSRNLPWKEIWHTLLFRELRLYTPCIVYT